jgi:hypothetical protein
MSKDEKENRSQLTSGALNKFEPTVTSTNNG